MVFWSPEIFGMERSDGVRRGADRPGGVGRSMKRPDTLARVLDAARDVVSGRVGAGTPDANAAERIFGALADSVGTIVREDADAPQPPSAHRFLAAALDSARASPAVATLAEAFAALAPELRWRRRPGAETHGPAFFEGHANADLVGPIGLEQRSDVLVGASLVAPQVRYVDHWHPPEELYIVMSEGDWFRGDRGWHTPGMGGIVYNPPNAVHAMRAGPEPLLALWLLPVDGPA